MPDCKHNGYHSGQGRYNRDSEDLRYVIVCDDCEQEVFEVGVEPYRPQFDPHGNQPFLQ